ncbi:MAG: aminopeptidase [bacterium]
MTDPRIDRMAGVIAGYSLGLGPGRLALLTGDVAGLPLLRAVFRRALALGALPVLRLADAETERILILEGSDEQLGHVPAFENAELEEIRARLVVRAPDNVAALAGTDPGRRALRARSRRSWFERFLERKAKGELASCLTQFPTEAAAQHAGMALADYEDFVYRACFVDRDDPVAAWQELSRGQQRYVDFLDTVAELRFEAPDLDLRLSVRGRKWINSDGRANFPSGEVFTGPVEDSAEGRVRFDIPAHYLGRPVEGAVLEFRAGRVVGHSADRGADALAALLDTDEGSRVLGEVAFGLNAGIDRPTGNILFDEKIGGTIHLAVGAGYPDSGSLNRSAVHADLIRRMDPGRVLADGRLIYENGRFTI